MASHSNGARGGGKPGGCRGRTGGRKGTEGRGRAGAVSRQIKRRSFIFSSPRGGRGGQQCTGGGETAGGAGVPPWVGGSRACPAQVAAHVRLHHRVQAGVPGKQPHTWVSLLSPGCSCRCLGCGAGPRGCRLHRPTPSRCRRLRPCPRHLPHPPPSGSRLRARVAAAQHQHGGLAVRVSWW